MPELRQLPSAKWTGAQMHPLLRNPLRKALKNNNFQAFWSSGASEACLGCSRQRLHHCILSTLHSRLYYVLLSSRVRGEHMNESPRAAQRFAPRNPYEKLSKAIILKLFGAPERLGLILAAPAALSGGGQREEINENTMKNQMRPENYQYNIKYARNENK